MRDWSLRVWLLLISLVFSVLLVGGVALTTYTIISDGMQLVARETSARISETVGAIVREAVSDSEVAAAERGLTGDAAVDVATSDLRRRLPALLSGANISGVHLALYASDLRPYWYTSRVVLGKGGDEQRARAAQMRVITSSEEGTTGFVSGLINRADLGDYTTHVPIRMPDGATGVLDVAYAPSTEEHVIDAIRVPMVILTAVTMLVMIVLMQTSMAWVLSLVNNLRKAADSIDAGRLDERLPEGGGNEIGELAHSVNSLIERLQRRAEAQGRFVADASHELATPVAGIRGYTSILRAWGADDPKVREEAVDAIDRESRRMARLTSELLNLLHADQGLRLRSERFDLNAVARERLAATANVYLDRAIEFVGPEDDQLFMVGDSGRMEDVLSILLDNAGKYTPNGGTVALLTERVRDEIVITVCDTGRGISAEDLPRLFDRFFRSDQARSEGESGFGLGLAIAKSIVENMGGSISAESELGEGTTFTITVPRGRL